MATFHKNLRELEPVDSDSNDRVALKWWHYGGGHQCGGITVVA